MTLRIREGDFAAIAAAHPELWRRIATALAERLRRRNQFVTQRNAEPRVFVGSSREGLEVADSIQAALAPHPFVVTVWTNGVFGPSNFTLEALGRVAHESGLVLGPDDRVISQKKPVSR